mmetsp:Transcript_85187/g.135025  ORF Transcript_85187/g.135025 Transcript_85187/m.135025 type:complete len:311 (+) Transcript_85187:1817-2749(+)
MNSVMESEEHNVTMRHLQILSHLEQQILHRLVSVHFQGMPRRDVVIPKSREATQIALQDQIDPEFVLQLHLLSPSLLQQAHLRGATLHHPAVHLLGIWNLQDLLRAIFADVDQHVRVVDASTCRPLKMSELGGEAFKVVAGIEIGATEIVLHRGILATWRDVVIVKFHPLVIQGGSDVGIVMSAVYVTTVNHHRMKKVVPRPRDEFGEVQPPRELEATVQLDHVHPFHVKVESLQLQIQHARKLHKADTLLCPLFAKALSLVEIVSVQHLIRGEFSQRLLDCLKVVAFLALDVELNVVERLGSFGGVVHI